MTRADGDGHIYATPFSSAPQQLSEIHPDAALEEGRHWQAHIALELACDARRTFVAYQTHSGPLRIQRPFYPEGFPCHLYLLHPPGGVVGGDRLMTTIRVRPQAHILVTQPGATKLYRSDGRVAQLHQQITVETNAICEWLPQETIAFNGTQTQITTAFQLTSTAKLAAWEVLCLGRPACSEAFTTGALESRLQVSWDKRPLLWERLRLMQPHACRRLLGDFPVMGNFLLFPADAALLEAVRSWIDAFSRDHALDNTIPIGVTRLEDLLVLRMLSPSTALTLDLFRQLWRQIRPSWCGLTPSMPRIWRA